MSGFSFRSLKANIKETLRDIRSTRDQSTSRFSSAPRTILLFSLLYLICSYNTGVMAHYRPVIGPAPPQVPWQPRPTPDAIRKKYGITPEHENLPDPIRVFVNAAYYPNWAVYKQGPPSSLNLACLSHVFYAFVHVKPDGTLSLSDEWADTQIEVDGTKGCLRAFGMLKQEHKHLKVILSIGGGGPGGQHFASVAANPRARQMFAYSAHQMVTEYGFDGIDIDWEHPQNHSQGRDYISLLQEIRRYLPAPTYLLTSALPAGEWALQHIDVYAASQLLDLVNIMAYDFSGPWTPHSGHQAQLYSPERPHNDHATHSGHRAVTYLQSKHVPLQKILLGIPVYGRSFLRTNSIGQKPHGAGGEDGVFLYKDLPRPGAGPEIVDDNVVAAYSIGGDGGFVTYDNPTTVGIKANYVREMGLRGIFFWTGAADVRTGERSLIETSYVTLHSQL